MVEPADCDVKFDQWFENHDRLGQLSFEELCSTSPGCEARFREKWRDYERVNAALESGTLAMPSSGRQTSWSDFLYQLKRLGPPNERYVRGAELDRGGMGAIYHAGDALLKRRLVVKVLRAPTANEPDSTPANDDRSLGRFLEEAQVTARLDHPYIVPVHDLGVDDSGQVYFAMKRVRGEDLRRIFHKIGAGIEGWSLTRGLQVMLKVCEAMAYAHARGVLHRDLKPGNIMIGRYGEVYVMDWGLARILDQADTKDVRIRLDSTDTILRSQRKALQENLDRFAETPLITMDGDVVGTPSYMPLEQAEGNLEAMGPRSDIYAVGAMLYQLLSGSPPYVGPGENVSGRVVLERVKSRAPDPLDSLAPRAALELVAITEKAMFRYPSGRYSDMAALASDLQAYLEVRVVTAYETGSLAELKKWVQRNRSLATAAIALLMVLIGGSIVLLRKNGEAAQANADLRSANARIRESETQALVQSNLVRTKNAELGRQQSQLEIKNADLQLEKEKVEYSIKEISKARAEAEAREGESQELNAELQSQAAELNQLNQKLAVREEDLKTANAELTIERDQSYARSLLLGAEIIRELTRTEAALLPAHPDRIQEMFEWISEAAVVSQLAPKIVDAIAGLEDRSVSLQDSKSDNSTSSARKSSRGFSTESDRFLYGALIQLRSDLQQFESGPKRRVERRYAWTWRVTQLSLHHPHARVSWDDARAAIATANGITASTAYRRIRIDLQPQVGLVPIGMNPATKLWEFYDLRSASSSEREQSPEQILIPTHRPDGSIPIDDQSGIIFVLLPGGTFLQGAQNLEPSSDNFDPDAQLDEQPQPVILAPVFVSRHEVTRAQWSCLLTDVELTSQGSGDSEASYEESSVCPITSVDWRAADFVLRSHGLRLPTEAQWEYAARGGSSTPWWPGSESRSLIGVANILGIGDERVDSQSTNTMPVGSFRPNGFGLYDVHGNVWEWCADEYAAEYFEPRAYDGLRTTESTRTADRVIRGGDSSRGSSSNARCANRSRNPPNLPLPNIGFRAARDLDRME